MRSSVLTRACTWPNARAKPRDGGLTQPRRSPFTSPFTHAPAAPPVGPACRPGGCGHRPAPVGMVAAHTLAANPLHWELPAATLHPMAWCCGRGCCPHPASPRLPKPCTGSWHTMKDLRRIVQRARPPQHQSAATACMWKCVGWSRAAGTTTASCWGRPPAPPATPAPHPPCMHCRGACAWRLRRASGGSMATTPPGAMSATTSPTWCCFWATTSTNTPRPKTPRPGPHPHMRYATTLADHRDRYALHKSDPALQAAHAACPWAVTWDDHEVQNDYAGGTNALADAAAFLTQRAAAWQAFYENMPPRATAWRARSSTGCRCTAACPGAGGPVAPAG